MKKFNAPNFKTGEIELRFEDNVICIYATASGLGKLAKYCTELTEHPNQGHIHLENYGILTNKSCKGAIAIFEK